jgi:aspartate/methionine/tyrosine aminotransferase
MRFSPFLMERYQSRHEHAVAMNLTGSGVHAPSLDELAAIVPGVADDLGSVFLGYVQTNGSLELRRRVAASYEGATPEHVEITNGGAEANFCLLGALLHPGDRVVMMTPNYLQPWGAAEAFGAEIDAWPLRFDGSSWRADLGELERLAAPGTKLIAVCTPNNPTGMRLQAGELDRIAEIAARCGAWVLSDEIYAGSELDGVATPSMWGRYERAVCTSGLSKAFGLPGLRIGWIVAPPELIEDCWTVHDYTTICPAALNDHIATKVLESGARDALLERGRTILRENLAATSAVLREEAPDWRWASPEAGGMLFVRYGDVPNSTDLAERMRVNHSVLVVPGDHFGMDGFLRIGIGSAPETLRGGVAALLEELKAERTR